MGSDPSQISEMQSDEGCRDDHEGFIGMRMNKNKNQF